MTPYERLCWVGLAWCALIAASCALAPLVVLGEMQRQAGREAEPRPSNVVPMRRRG